jgi:hypothetical protein
MSNKLTLEQVKQLASELPPPEQLNLMAYICECLSARVIGENDHEKTRQERLTQVESWLAECDAVAESIEGEFDSAEDMRQIREER